MCLTVGIEQLVFGESKASPLQELLKIGFGVLYRITAGQVIEAIFIEVANGFLSSVITAVEINCANNRFKCVGKN